MESLLINFHKKVRDTLI